MEELRGDIREALAKIDEGATTAWALKMALKISHTRLFLALGALVERGKISLTPENGTYKIARLEDEAPIPIRTDRPRIAAP